MNREDRRDVGKLHPGFTNGKPTVVPNQAKSSIWNKPPTEIIAPSNQAQRQTKTRTGGFNPFSRSTMGSGNKTRDSTLTNHHEKNRQGKRQKTSHEVPRGGTVVAARGNPKYASSVPLASDLPPGAHEPIDVDEPMPPSDPLNLASGQDVTEIFDDDEDRPYMGQLDKGKGREGAGLARRLEKSCSMDDFEFDGIEEVPQPPPQIQSVKSAPPVSTRKRQRGVNEDAVHSRSASPIEYFSSSPTATSSRPPPKRKTVKHAEIAPRGTVKALVGDYEKRLENGPRIDLRQQQQAKGPGLKNGMKGKSSTPGLKPAAGPSKLPVNQEDPLISSTFKKQTKSPYFGRQSANGVSGPDVSLPLNQFYLGVRRLDGDDWVVSWGEGDTLVLKSGDANTTFDSYEFDMRKEIASVMYLPLQELEDDGIGMKILTGHSRRDFPETKHFFNMGDKHAGAIVLSFNKTHRDWDPDSYNGLVQWMKHRTQTDTVGIGGFRSALRTAHDKYEAWVQQESRRPLRKPTGLANKPSSEATGQATLDGLLSRGNSRSRPSSRSTPDDENEASVRRSSRIKPTPLRRQSPPINMDEVVLCYPQGVPGAINITNGDLMRLDPSEYLNDTLIEFGLKLWLHQLERSNKELRDQIHVFSSFFYKKLNRKDIKEGYESVRKWTAKVDIFSKKYIIVPINENFHWYLVIIYHPEHVLLPPPPAPVQKELATRSRKSIVAQSGSLQDVQAQVPPPIDAIPSEQATAEDSEVQTNPPSPISEETTKAISDMESGTSFAHSNQPMEVEQSEASFAPEYATAPEDRSETHYGSEISDEASVTKQLFVDSGQCSVEIVDVEDSPAPANMLNELGEAMDTDRLSDSSRRNMEVDQHIPTNREAHPASPTLSEMENNETSEQIASPDVEMQEQPTVDPMNIDDLEHSEESGHAAQEKPRSVRPRTFYGSKPKQASSTRKDDADPIILSDEESSQPKPEPEPEEEEDTSSPDTTPYIFTMDSLGSRHPQAIKQLGSYLQLEAADKKGIMESTRAVGKQASVPAQTNFCDCGLYLLHFAQTFMSDPDKFARIIKKGPRATTVQERKDLWHDTKPAGMRESLKAEILTLADEWKKEKEEAKKKVKEEAQPGQAPVGAAPADPTPIETIESSDDEVDIVATNMPPSPVAGKRKRRETTPAPVRGKAARLRG